MEGTIGITIGEKGDISWNREGKGLRLREFVTTYPCLALKFLAQGGTATELGEGILSTVGGRKKLLEFNQKNMCGIEDNLIQQI